MTSLLELKSSQNELVIKCHNIEDDIEKSFKLYNETETVKICISKDLVDIFRKNNYGEIYRYQLFVLNSRTIKLLCNNPKLSCIVIHYIIDRLVSEQQFVESRLLLMTQNYNNSI